MQLNKWVKIKGPRRLRPLRNGSIFGRHFLRCFVSICLLTAGAFNSVSAQENYENRPITETVITFEGTDKNIAAGEQYRTIVRDALGSTYSTVRVRDAIDRLYQTQQIAVIHVEASPVGDSGVFVRFVIKRKTQAQRVSVIVADQETDPVTEQELLLRLNLMEAGTAISQETLDANAEIILEYLRDLGYYKATVTHRQDPLANENEVAVTFNVTPGEQATVQAFNINIQGYDNARLADKIKLKPGEGFNRAKLTADVEKIRSVLREDDLLAPRLNEPRFTWDRPSNTITIELTGTKGPVVKVEVEAERDNIGSGTQSELLPIKREGTLDFAAIIEGERRLENHYQEKGYFFVNVVAVCSVEPPLVDADQVTLRNNTEFLCSALNSNDLESKEVTVKYVVNLDRKLKLSDIRLEGTEGISVEVTPPGTPANKVEAIPFTIEGIQPVLESQEATAWGIIPLFGYGRGYTSERLIEEDASTIRSLLREIGYRDATVRATRGVSLDGENLIITFIAEPGPRTMVTGIDINGNMAFSDDALMAELAPLYIVDNYYSRARARSGQRKIAEYYSKAGYYDTIVEFSTTGRTDDPVTGERKLRIEYDIKHRPSAFAASVSASSEPGVTVDGEGRKYFVDRVLVTGHERTKESAIKRAVTLEPGELLTAAGVYASEQNLFSSDAFSSVQIKPRTVSERANGDVETDVIVSVQEQAPRILSYGGGFSTDLGVSAFADLRHFNLLGNLWQGGGRIRLSQRQQLAQIDFVNPRFLRDGEDRFAPLTITAQYQRDSTVTRFFRSAFDKGTFGIVQRIDEEGNPIDEFGAETGSPTLHRLTFSAETNRTISREKRSVLFFRYRFEDVRLYNIQSLLIKDLLIPDSRIRISGFGATFARDTRENCAAEYSLLDLIANGNPTEPCRYSASDPTNGSYLTAEYNVSLPVLGANTGFNKFQASYNFYYTLPALKHTTFAARGIIGLAHVFANGNRFSPTQFPDLDGILPISERFFAGGSNTLRGFGFEEAGPRVVVVPQGTFRNREGEPVFLDPFTIPFGGNALAVVNLEARIPLSRSFKIVPFYDGGNVFRRVKDIFNPPDVPEGDVFRQNLRVLWSHTVGLGLRFKLPIGGEIGVDYGYLLNPPRFLIPQVTGPNAIYQLPQGHFHFRFSQAF